MTLSSPAAPRPRRRRATDVQNKLLAGLRASGGRATLGDLMAASALPAATIEAEILGALSLVGGSVAVDEQGVLTYRAGRRRRRYGPSPWDKAKRALYAGVRFTVYGGLLLVLVAYFFVYLFLLLAALMAAGSCGCDDACSCDDGCDGCDSCCSGGGDSAAGGADSDDAESEETRDKPQAGESRPGDERGPQPPSLTLRAQLTLALGRLRERLDLHPDLRAPLGVGMTMEDAQALEKPPLYRVVRDWVFGPPAPPVDHAADERNILAFLRAHAGRITATEVTWLTGLDWAAADGLALDLAARYAGDLEVSDEGVIVYAFERLVTRAGGPGVAAAPGQGADEAMIRWLRDRGGEATVQEAAAHLAVSAQEALESLQLLGRAGRGHMEFGARTRFVLEAEEDAQRGGPPGGAAAPEPTGSEPTGSEPTGSSGAPPSGGARTYSFAWDHMETRPSLHGHPQGAAQWIPKLNTFNLVLASVSLLYFAPVSSESLPDLLADFSPVTVFVMLGVVPFIFSTLVFVIPKLRRLAWRLAEPKAQARNAWRVWLLVVYRRLLEGPDLTTEAAARALFQARDAQAVAAAGAGLDEVRRRLEGEVDAEAGLDEAGGYVYRFAKLDAEQRVADRLRLAFDPAAHVAGPASFDSADDGW